MRHGIGEGEVQVQQKRAQLQVRQLSQKTGYVTAQVRSYWLEGSPSELLEEDVAVEAFLGVDEGNLRTQRHTETGPDPRRTVTLRGLQHQKELTGFMVLIRS